MLLKTCYKGNKASICLCNRHDPCQEFFIKWYTAVEFEVCPDFDACEAVEAGKTVTTQNTPDKHNQFLSNSP